MMNQNIEIINANLWAVNMQYVKSGYVQELRLLQPDYQQINLSKEGTIILDKGSRAYPALKKLFLICMDKSTEELEKIVKMQANDSLNGICQNVAGWEIKRRCVQAEYLKSHSRPDILNKIKQTIRKKVKQWHLSKQE